MDPRSLRQKLEAMAERGTEHEREVARTKLEAMGPPPPPPPTRNAAAMPPWNDGDGWMTFTGPDGTVVRFRNVTVRWTGTNGSATWSLWDD